MTAAYLRASTESQEKRETVKVQRKEFETTSARTGQQFEFYVDDGVSGEVLLEARPAGRRLLEELKAGRVERVVVWRTDRLARGMLPGYLALKEIERFASVESLTEGPITGDRNNPNPNQLLTTAVYFGMASAEKGAIRLRTKLGSER